MEGKLQQSEDIIQPIESGQHLDKSSIQSGVLRNAILKAIAGLGIMSATTGCVVEADSAPDSSMNEQASKTESQKYASLNVLYEEPGGAYHIWLFDAGKNYSFRLAPRGNPTECITYTTQIDQYGSHSKELKFNTPTEGIDISATLTDGTPIKLENPCTGEKDKCIKGEKSYLVK